MDAEDAKLFGNLLTNFQRINKRIEEKEQEIVQVWLILHIVLSPSFCAH